MSVFYDHVMNESKIIGEILRNQKDMLPLSNEQQTKYNAATHCTACGTTFTAKIIKFVTTVTSAAIFYFQRAITAIYS